MGESAEMGGREGGRGRSKDGTMLRIDHSDVYIENERLGENLLHKIDAIRRRRYQKVMSRDSEINELKQSLLTMKQVSNRSISGSKKTKGVASVRRSKVATNDLTNGNVKGKEPQRDKRKTGDKTSTSPFKSIEIRIPPAKLNNTKGNYSGDSDTDDDDDDDDDDDESESDLDSSDDDDDEDDDNDDDSFDGEFNKPKTNGLNRHPIQNNINNRPMSRTITSASTVSTRIHNNNKNNNMNHNGGFNSKDIKRIDPLTRIMSRLNLDKLPPSWYTQVVPASDVHVSKRIIGVDGNNNISQQNGLSKKSKSRKNCKASPQVRPSTTAGDIFRQDSKLPIQRQKSQIQMQQERRPFTTTGVRSRGGDGGDERSRSRMDVKSSNGNSDERSQSVLFCEQAAYATKTMRQLKEEEMQSTVPQTHNPIGILLEEVKEEQKVIDEKVKRFVKSLDERKRSERLKKLKSEMNLIRASSPL